MIYAPDEYVNRIRERKKPQKDVRGQYEIHFATWEEAHSWMVHHRLQSVERAKRELRYAERSLAKAREMAPKLVGGEQP